MKNVHRETANVACSDGWTLAVEILLPEAPRAVALCSHGMGVDKRTLGGRHWGLASFLADREIAVVLADLRGHGMSGPLAAEGGRWSYDDLVEQDTPSLARFARGLLPDLPLVAVGHSLFSNVALAHVARSPHTEIDALVMLGGNVWLPRWEPSFKLRLQKRLVLEGMGIVAKGWRYFPARRLRLGNNDESADFVMQLISFFRQDDWVSDDGFSYAAALKSVDRPVLSIACAGDKLLCRPESARPLATLIPGADYRTVGKATGLPTDSNHMGLILDRRCRSVWAHVANFIVDRVASPSHSCATAHEPSNSPAQGNA